MWASVPNGGKVFKVQISGAVPAPLFVMGKTTPEQWAEQLENTKAPWGEICMPRLIVTMPVEQLKRCPDVQKTAEFLQKNMALQDWIMGWDTKPDRLHHPMRFVVDRQISAGAGHSGYPAMATKDWTDSIASGSITIPEAGGCGMNWGITTSRLRLRWRARRKYPSTSSPWSAR